VNHDRITSLDAIYGAESGATFMTGIQALVRLPLMQRRLDRKRGLSTAGLVSGYRGSPLSAYDQQLWKAREYLDAHDVVFQPGLNEDLAATALWGAQMHKAYGPTRADGVFGIWYGKGNGVDRTADVFRNANMLGTSPLGGVLAVGGDDHAAQSSMFPHQTDGIFQSVQMPVLQPADVSEILTLGLAGIAMSRFAGVWVAMKTIAEVVESAAGFDLPDGYPEFLSPDGLVPPHGLNWDPTIAWPAQRAEYERRMIEERLPAAIGWATANRLDGPVLSKPDGARIAGLEAELFAGLPEPAIAPLAGVYNVYVAGIGGLGVLTVGALIGTAAHLSGLRSTVLDFTGLAQKNGAVVSQVRIAPADARIHAVRIGAGETDLLLATDAVVATSADALAKFARGRGRVVLNGDEAPTADVVADRDASLPTGRMIETLLERAGENGFVLGATRIAEGLFGNSVAANTLLVGYAWQKGLLPLTAAAFEAAIEANGAAVALNKRAFAWGRMAAIDIAKVERIAGIAAPARVVGDIDALVERRTKDLIAYQGADYAARYAQLVRRVRAASLPYGAEGEALLRAVAVNAYKLMAYKDEYEVARLYAEPAFRAELDRQFAGARRVSVWLAPPLLSRIDARTGRPAKRKFGPWIFGGFSILAGLKVLRGSWADPFGRSAERRAERALRDEYLATIGTLCEDLDGAGLARATAIAALPDRVRGFGPVKHAAMADYAAERERLLAMSPPAMSTLAVAA